MLIKVTLNLANVVFDIFSDALWCFEDLGELGFELFECKIIRILLHVQLVELLANNLHKRLVIFAFHS